MSALPCTVREALHRPLCETGGNIVQHARSTLQLRDGSRVSRERYSMRVNAQRVKHHLSLVVDAAIRRTPYDVAVSSDLRDAFKQWVNVSTTGVVVQSDVVDRIRHQERDETQKVLPPYLFSLLCRCFFLSQTCSYNTFRLVHNGLQFLGSFPDWSI
jgi:hypothetical protein